MAFKPLIRICWALALSASAMGVAKTSAQTSVAQAGPVTVVVAVALAANATPSEALSALNDIRTMMQAQPGYLSEELLQNLNQSNSPRFVLVSRWASMAYWAALFSTPGFAALSAHGSTHYSISASAFVPAD